MKSKDFKSEFSRTISKSNEDLKERSGRIKLSIFLFYHFINFSVQIHAVVFIE